MSEGNGNVEDFRNTIDQVSFDWRKIDHERWAVSLVTAETFHRGSQLILW